MGVLVPGLNHLTVPMPSSIYNSLSIALSHCDLSVYFCSCAAVASGPVFVVIFVCISFLYLLLAVVSMAISSAGSCCGTPTTHNTISEVWPEIHCTEPLYHLHFGFQYDVVLPIPSEIPHLFSSVFLLAIWGPNYCDKPLLSRRYADY